MKKLAVCLLMILVLAIPVSANDGVLGRNAEGVYPMEDNDVEMVSEDILLTYVNGGPSRVDCTFVFHNTGEAKSVLMGFPAMVNYDEDYLLGDPGDLKLKNFTAYRNGVEIEVTEVDGTTIDNEYTDYSSWYVFEVPFDENETLTMTHSYDMHLWGDSSGSIMMAYVLETGRTWKNNIGHTKITFDISAFNGYALQGIFSDFPDDSGFPLSDLRYEDDKIIFEKYDFEPDFNITLWLSYWGYRDFWDIENFRTEEQWESVRFFDEAPGLAPDELIRAYNDLSYDNKLAETLYLNTVLGLPEEQHAPVAYKINTSGEYAYILIEDRNYDMMPGAGYKIMDSNWHIKKQGATDFFQIFGDYGMYKFIIRERVPGDIYEVTAYDHAGNSSVAILNSYGDFYSADITMADEPAHGDPVAENPKTNATIDYSSLGIAFLCGGLLLLNHKKKSLN